MAERSDAAAFGPASQFFAHLDYYLAVGKSLRLGFDDIADKRIIPGYNVEADDIEVVDLGVNVYIGGETGVSIEQVTMDGEPTPEVVEWVEGGFTFAEQHRNDGRMVEATEVGIVD